MNARVVEKIDNFLLKIQIENKDGSQKGKHVIIVDKNSDWIGRKNGNYIDQEPQISSSSKEQSNSDDLETQANKSEITKNFFL